MTGGHERFQGDAAAYALGALEDAEVRAFEAHLAGCERCRAELAAMQEAVAALPDTVPALAAPPALKERVMAVVGAEAAAEPPRHAASGRPGAVLGGWLRPGRMAPALAAAAAVVLALVLVLGGGNSTHTYAAIVHASGARASLLRSGHAATLRVSRLPAPPEGRIYEIWLERGSQPPEPTNALFTTTTGTVAVPGDMSGVRAVLVTDEPKPYGSRAPTRAPIIVVRLQ
jgi:anti-sigma-K factor RskA